MNFLKLASDLENPLSSMMMICDSMLEVFDQDESLSNVFSMLTSQANLLLSSVGNMRDLRSIMHGTFDVNRGEFKPRRTFEAIVAQFAHQADMQHSELTFHELPDNVETQSLLQPYMHYM